MGLLLHKVSFGGIRVWKELPAPPFQPPGIVMLLLALLLQQTEKEMSYPFVSGNSVTVSI